MIENEFKLMLSKEQYEKLLGLYDFETIVQTNHYYDTDGLEMSSRHITVRVRVLGGKFFLQMKLPTDKSYSRVELSRELDALPASIPGANLSALSGTECPDVTRLGELTTTRSVYEFGGGELDLDRSEYFDKTDYEAEIEFTDENAARALLGELSEKLGITRGTDSADAATEAQTGGLLPKAAGGAEVCAGKVRRFLEEYEKWRDKT